MSDVDALIGDALTAARGTDVRLAERQLDRLVVGDPAVVDAALVARLVRAVGRLWPRGWQPVDVARIVARRAGARPARLLTDVLAADRRGHATAPAWWDEQLAALDARVWWDDDGRHLADWMARERLDRVTALREAVEVLAVLDGLPPVAVLRPPPGAGQVTAGPGPRGSRMLDRVRALLAKAESTGFPAEAEALTAKAQELMARHSIDRVLLDTGPADQPGGVRLGTDPPYAGAKALLVQEVAAANRCEAVWSDDLGFSTVLGFPADLDAVEVLYTSLLVQATSAMLRGRAERRATSSRRTREYDESFLQAYALRIGERLRAATERTSREAARADGGDRLLPVLASRSDAVRQRAEALFPGVTRGRLTVRDAEGWSSGTAAADRAVLDAAGGSPRRLRDGRRPGGRSAR
ncbi:DUF2786 domain-containing protein [Micromonospora sagamiensis]|uniref:Uncharacterized protein DUF2786 n=1 Tax=Micromonospora sagamiensis TaxID=47875 RepID=A0A562WFT2_9ACTN|nr:DUF2786 domain-containing protein [Micromonospora sagamiensis]TWJ29102.1 uncharacterized protein DUF2786 [Micromonospora sagamiensis]BCL17873.1 hypothetical protein GCM10017556_56120 [Micromonospora sagamiensis]